MTQTRTRNALAEIPSRMSNLRVSTPESNRNTIRNFILDNPNDPTGSVTSLNEAPASSPDELIIRQRG